METNKNVGIWIRVSTEKQVEGESPEHHEARARQYAEAKGWNVVTIYRLDAMSGKSIMDYPETRRMLKDIHAKTISGIIFSKLARIARNTKELLEISELFREQKADLISLAEAIDTSSPAGRLFFTVIAAMAQWEREEIAERVAASVPVRAGLGKSTGGAATFGYQWVDNQLVISEAEGPVRKLMYEIFLRTKRKKTTATELNKLGYRTRNGSLFTPTTIERLIKDSTAKGMRRANYTKSLGEGKHWLVKPQSEWVMVSCPAVVDAAIWDECNALLEQNTKKRSPGPRTKYLLAGYVQCSCEEKMYVYSNNPIYKCKKCGRKIHVADIDEIYHEQLKSFLLTDTDVETATAKSETMIAEKETLLKTIQGEYDKLLRRAEKQTSLRIDGELSKEEFATFYRPVQERLRQIEAQLPELEADIDFLKIQSLSTDVVMQEAKDLYQNWPTMPMEEKRSIVETITDKLIISDDSINISLSYLPPAPSFPNAGKSTHNFTDSYLL